MQIRIVTSTDWGSNDYTNEDREAYERAVYDMVMRKYPTADLKVSSKLVARDEVHVYALATDEEEYEVMCNVRASIRQVWDDAEFWCGLK